MSSVEEPEKASDSRTGTLVTSVDKYNDLTGRSVAAITAGIADLAGVDSVADTSYNATGILTLPDQNTSVNKKVLATCQPSVSP